MERVRGVHETSAVIGAKSREVVLSDCGTIGELLLPRVQAILFG